MKKFSTIALLLLLVITLVAEVVPHPMMKAPVSYNNAIPSDKFPRITRNGEKELPDKVLVFMVQFADVKIITEPTYPDFLVHDQNFFDRYMLQLVDYLYDASHQQYLLNYQFYPEVVTLDRNMGYYGSDENTRQRIAEFAQEIVQKTDANVDFNEFDTFIVFHAGAGQETDVQRIRPELLWSTFLSRRNLQLGLDPENDDYQGIPADGTFVTDFIIAPEHQWQDYFPQDGSVAPYGNLGVIASGFGYAMGLPNLSDNVPDNGTSGGIGYWGIMGSGAWNADGYIPALPCAWSRYYLGWETPVEITADTYNIPIDYLLDKSPLTPHVYKINISEKEYYLIENRAQNPDKSTLNGQANFTFPLLPEDEQIYYPLHEGQWEKVPKFDFMTNRLKGCEWDFYLPGYAGFGYMPVDGSGLLIWHIDEFVIEENFNPDIGLNRVNGDANHKGVDLKEADGIPHLDLNPNLSVYSLGSPEDAYRAPLNTYLGFDTFNGLFHTPTAESHYGGIPFEISGISEADNQMSFDVTFKWNLSTDYLGTNRFSALSLKMKSNEANAETVDRIILPNGNKLTIFEDNVNVAEFSLDYPIFKHYSYDEIEELLLIPTQRIVPGATATLNYYDGTQVGTAFTQQGLAWTSPVVIHKQENDNNYKYYCALNNLPDSHGIIKILDNNLLNLIDIRLEEKMRSNLIYSDQLMVITKDNEYSLNFIDEENGTVIKQPLAIPADSTISNTLLFDFNPLYDSLELVVQGKHGFYVFTSADYSLINYIETSVESTVVPSLVDFDKNGTWDLVLGYKDGVKIITYNGELIDNDRFRFAPTPNDSLIVYGGAFALDYDDSGDYKIAGTFSRHRTAVWNSHGRFLSGFPTSNYSDGRSYPFYHLENNKLYLYTTVDKANISRVLLQDVDNSYQLSDVLTNWYTEYNSYHRNAVENNKTLPNTLKTDDIFVKGQVFVYPNPFNATINNSLTLRAMVSRSCEAKLEIYNVAGKMIHREIKELDPYLGNLNKFNIPYTKMTSGVYIARLKAEGRYKEIKFALEK